VYFAEKWWVWVFITYERIDVMKEAVRRRNGISLIFIFVFIIAAVPVFGSMGQPTAGLQKDQFSVSLEFVSAETDIHMNNSGDITLESDGKLARIGYGLEDWWEIYVNLGVADAELDNLKGETRFAWGLGTKLTVAKDRNVSWGAMLQVDWMESEDKVTGTIGRRGPFSESSADIEWYEIRIAAGPTYKEDKWTIYGGPFFLLLEGDVSVNNVSYDIDMEDESDFGGYLGASYSITESASIGVEYQLGSDSEVVGVNLCWKF